MNTEIGYTTLEIQEKLLEDEQKITQEKIDYLKWRLSIVAKEKKHLTERIHRLELEQESVNLDCDFHYPADGKKVKISRRNGVYISKNTSQHGYQYKVYLNIRSEEFVTIGRQERYTPESTEYWGEPDFKTYTKQYCRALLGKVRILSSIYNLELLKFVIKGCMNEISNQEIKETLES